MQTIDQSIVAVETSRHLTSRRVRQSPGNAAQSPTGGRPFEPADLRSSPPTVSASAPAAPARRLSPCSPNRELLHRADPETPSPLVSPPPERTSFRRKCQKRHFRVRDLHISSLSVGDFDLRDLKESLSRIQLPFWVDISFPGHPDKKRLMTVHDFFKYTEKQGRRDARPWTRHCMRCR